MGVPFKTDGNVAIHVPDLGQVRRSTRAYWDSG